MRPPASPYLIRLREIPPAGLQQTFDLSGDFARRALAETEADAVRSSVRADVELQKTGHDVYARGRLAGQVTLPCSRCLASAEVPVDGRFEGREGCKGLCAQCGKDLNEGPCDCPPPTRDDRWQALKNVKL
jgi:uncharacterized metal-binding protein YceD (DUF177 family)